MILTTEDLRLFRALPEVEDRITAARISSVIAAVAALWLFVSPWAYFGVDHTASAWNAWIMGALIFMASSIALFFTRQSTPFSWFAAVLAAWVLISPFVFGYTQYLGRLINSLSVGAVILGFSLMAGVITRSIQKSRVSEPARPLPEVILKP